MPCQVSPYSQLPTWLNLFSKVHPWQKKYTELLLSGKSVLQLLVTSMLCIQFGQVPILVRVPVQCQQQIIWPWQQRNKKLGIFTMNVCAVKDWRIVYVKLQFLKSPLLLFPNVKEDWSGITFAGLVYVDWILLLSSRVSRVCLKDSTSWDLDIPEWRRAWPS